jgi:hypothetical protein
MISAGDILLPTAYFPPVVYFAFLSRNKEIHIEQMETFPKQTFRNRCEIMTDQGKACMVVPVTKPQGNHTLTKNIEICYREPWNRSHWKTLQAGYSSSPFFDYYADTIQVLFESHEAFLVNHNQTILKAISGLIGMQASVKYTDNFEKKPEGMLDLRSGISPKKNFITRIEFPEYPQVFRHKHGFMPNLSILDLLFNVGPEAGSYLERIVLKEVDS